MPSWQVRQHLGEETAGVVRGHDAENDFSIAQGFGQRVRGRDRFRDAHAGKEEVVAAALENGGADFALEGPELDVVTAFASEDDGEGGAPGSGADDGDAAHALPSVGLPAGKRFSVPAIRR